MSCACRTGNRQIVLVIDFEHSDHDEIIDYASLAGWEIRPEHQAIIVPIGPDHSLKTRCEVGKLLCGVLGSEKGRRIQFAPLQPTLPFEQQTAVLQQAQVLVPNDEQSNNPIMELLEERRIETWIQPVLAASDFSIWGFECLMRARDGEGQIISPAKIIESAREENLLFMLDRVCRETHLQNASRFVEDRNLRILINFLPTAIYQPQFCLRSTFATAKKCNLDPRKVVFEVVETEAVDDGVHLQKILEEYRRNGFGVALDDVGAGFAGLQLLADLQPDLIKIDREMVTQATTSHWYETICRMLIQAGHEQGKLVLAEGVETAEQEAAMLDLGIDLLQGFRYARPTATTEIERPEDTLSEAFQQTC